jgi:hypothetical protein
VVNLIIIKLRNAIRNLEKLNVIGRTDNDLKSLFLGLGTCGAQRPPVFENFVFFGHRNWKKCYTPPAFEDLVVFWSSKFKKKRVTPLLKTIFDFYANSWDGMGWDKKFLSHPIPWDENNIWFHPIPWDEKIFGPIPSHAEPCSEYRVSRSIKSAL